MAITFPGSLALSANCKSALATFLVVALWALFGIITRPVEQLAAIWPANAILLGLYIRIPALARPAGWIAAFLGYLAADLATGSSLQKSVILTAPNLTGIAVSFLIFRRLPPEQVSLSSPLSVIIMVCVLAVGSAMAGVAGIFAGHYLFGLGVLEAFILWSVTELINYIVILPVLLTLPAIETLKPPYPMPHLLRRGSEDLMRAVPIAAILLSMIAGKIIGGPGAVAFPVLALLWAAVTYSRFLNSILSFLFAAWTLIAIAKGYFPVPIDLENMRDVLSLRIGVMLIALAPLMVASVMASRSELLERLRLLAMTDNLTNTLNRTGFFQAASTLQKELHDQQAPVAVLMIDIDHFKTVNDTYGHPAGDVVLQTVAQTLKQNLRATDPLGRIGGEEFCVLAPRPSKDMAGDLAERLCKAVRNLIIDLPGRSAVQVTISVGVIHAQTTPDNLEALIAEADNALYRAKNEGRDRVVMVANP